MFKYLLFFLFLINFSTITVDSVLPLKLIEDRINGYKLLTQEDLLQRYEKRHLYPSVENVLLDVKDAIDNDNINLTHYCAYDIEQLNIQLQMLTVNQSNDFTFDFLSLIDSSGKIGPGLLRGHKVMYGLMHQCQAIKYTFFNGHTFKGNYIALSFVATLEDANPETCNPAGPKSISIDLCMPDSCTIDDLSKIFALSNSTCSFNDVRTQDRGSIAGTYITTVVMCFCFLLGITASVYDYFIYPHHKHLAYTKSFPMKSWRAFSLYTNIVEIFNTKGANKPGNIGPLHCMRFFSMVWIMTGHTIGFFMAFASNPLDVMAITNDWGTQIITSAYFAVDTFFWQGGLLLSYIWFKKYNQNKRQAMSTFNWVMFYVHRIVRLSPPYYILIAFYTWIYTRKWLSNMAPYLHGPLDTFCDSNWWIDYLYLNNFVRYDKQCYLVSWYLSTDLQMYLFAPLIIIPFTFGAIPGLISALVIFALSTGMNIYTVLYHYFPPTDYSQAKMDPRMDVDYSFYTMMIYNAPWIRCQIYIIGLITGYFMQNVKKLRIPFYIQILGWLMTLGCVYGCIWSLIDWIKGNPIELGYSALYSATSKAGWGIALSWIVIACYYGYGSFINNFMSWSIWVPLGRLTYSAYLIHICVAAYFIGINQQGLVYTNFTQMFTQFCIPCVVASYFFAIIWSSSFEFAFAKLEDALIVLIMGQPRRPPPPEQSTEIVKIDTEDNKNVNNNNNTATNGTISMKNVNDPSISKLEDGSVIGIKITKDEKALL